MSFNNGSPSDWHQGCSTDVPRNEFVIPFLIRLCQSTSVNTAAFLGCATGYIPDAVGNSVSGLTMHLIDIDGERLSFAERLKYGHNKFVTHLGQLSDVSENLSVDLLVIANTLLEFNPDIDFFQAVAAALSSAGRVVVFLPDVLEDVVQEYVKGNRLALHNFINGVQKVEKIDKFTFVETNFYAHRMISLVASFLNAGLLLESVEKSETQPVYFALQFGRR